MTKAEILQIVYDLSTNRADPVTCDKYYDEIMDQLGRCSEEMTRVEVVSVTSGTSEYDLPSDCVVESAIIFDNRQLSKVTVNQLEAVNINWKDKVGFPIAYTKDELTARRIRLYPIPNVSTGPFNFTYGEPLGLDFPPNSLTYIFTSRNDDNVPYHLVLPIAFEIISYEFARPSKQQSIPYSQLCHRLAVMLFKISGIDWGSNSIKQEK